MPGNTTRDAGSLAAGRVARRALLLAALLALSACGRRETPVESGDREQVLHLGNGAEPGSLDPAVAFSVTDCNIVSALFEGLVAFAPDGKTIRPGAAERWEISPDGRTYTFHLRAGLRWSNGDPLTSAGFLYGLRRVIEPGLGSEMAVYAGAVAGATDYLNGKTHDLAAVGFDAPDAATFVITLRERTPYFLAIVATNPFFPVHQATVEKFNGYARREAGWARPGTLVGNGPFTLKDWRVNDRVSVERNPAYWDAGRVRLKEAVFHPIDQPDAEEKAFRGGLLHATRFLPTAKIAGYRGTPRLRADPLAGTQMIELNVGRAPFADPRVRRAFTLAIDRGRLVREVLRDGSRPGESMCVPGSGTAPGYQPRDRLAYDPAAARALLAQAGFPGGSGLPAITLVLTAGKQNDQTLAEALQAMWQGALGVRVALRSQEEKVRLDALRTKDYQMAMFSWVDIDDPALLLQRYLSGSPNNFTGWSSPAYDAEFAAASGAASDPERLTHLQNADALINQEAPSLPLCHNNQSYLVQTSVRGWEENAINLHLLNRVYLEGKK